MKILVCLKQVPDANTRLAVASDGKWIDEDNVAFVPNEYDLFALEAALKLKDAGTATEVVVASIGPDRARQAIRTALAMGADRAVFLTDAAFQGGDAWSNALALAGVARTEGPFEAVFLGLQSADDNEALAGPLVAEHLAAPCATGVMALTTEEGALVCERELEADRREVVRLPLPAVVTFQTGSGETPPRYANIKGIMAAKKKEMKTPTPADLGLTPEQVGAAGRHVTVLSLGEPPKSVGAELLEGSADDIAQEIVRRIREKTGVI